MERCVLCDANYAAISPYCNDLVCTECWIMMSEDGSCLLCGVDIEDWIDELFEVEADPDPDPDPDPELDDL